MKCTLSLLKKLAIFICFARDEAEVLLLLFLFTVFAISWCFKLPCKSNKKIDRFKVFKVLYFYLRQKRHLHYKLVTCSNEIVVLRNLLSKGKIWTALSDFFWRKNRKNYFFFAPTKKMPPTKASAAPMS